MNDHNEKKEAKIEIIPQKSGEKALSLQEAVCQNCGTHFDRNKGFCPKCGLKTGSSSPAEIYINPAEQGAFSRASGILALLSFIFGLFGPLILGIGWLLGIIIGFNVIHTIRRKGGFIRDKRLASWGIILGFLWIILASLVIGLVSYHKITKAKLEEAVSTLRDIARRKEDERIAAFSLLEENERIAVSTLRDIALAQRYIKIGCFIDKDKNGQGEYASLDELFDIQQPYMKAKLDRQIYHGYCYTIHETSEISFLAEAAPMVYGKTGISVFYITHEGFLRGGDIKGKSIIDSDVILPCLFQGKNVYDNFNEQMAQQLLSLAKRLASEKHNFARAKAIFSGIKSFFPLSKSLEDLDRLSVMVENLIYEEKAVKAFQEAKILKSEKKDKEYLSALRSIKDTFPQAKIISEVEGEIEGLNLKFKKQLEEKAAEHKKQLEEKAARHKKQVEEKAARHKKQVEEEATGYIEKLFALSVEKDFDAITTAANLLKKKYPATEAFKRVKDKVEVQLTKAHFYKLKDEGLNYFKRKDFRQAIVSLEKGRKSYAYVDPDIFKALSESYLQEAYTYYEEKSWKKSFDSFQNYFNLKSSLPDDMSKKRYTEVCLKMAESFFQKKNTKEAAKFLDLIKGYSLPPGCAYLRGSIEAVNQKYEEAVNAFNREDIKSIEKDKADKLLIKRSLCCMGLYLEKEKELIKLFKDEKLFKEKGDKIAIDTAVLLQKMFAAESNLKLKSKSTKETRLVARAEAMKKLNEFRKESQTISQNIRKNNISLDKTTNIIQDMKNYFNDFNIFFKQFSHLKNKNHVLSQYSIRLRRKDYLYKKAVAKLISGVGYFKDIQEECTSIVDDAIDDFAERKSIDKYVKELNSYFQQMSIGKSTGLFEEAKHLFEKSLGIKMPISEYLASID